MTVAVFQMLVGQAIDFAVTWPGYQGSIFVVACMCSSNDLPVSAESRILGRVGLGVFTRLLRGRLKSVSCV